MRRPSHPVRELVAWWRRNAVVAQTVVRVKVLGVWAFLIWDASALQGCRQRQQDNNFTLNGADHLGEGISVGKLMETCLAENDRRLGIYDKRLKRPRFVPFMIRQIRRFIPN